MKKAKILVTKSEDIYLECPCCGHWEAQPVDSPRHHLQTFSIIVWEEDVEGLNEVSTTACIPCKMWFKLEWDYKNIDTE